MRRSILAPFLVALVVATSHSEASRILGLFPHFGESHFIFFEPILRALDTAGHEVHIVSHFEMKNVSDRFQNIIISNPGSTNDAVDMSLFNSRVSYGHFHEFFLLRGWGAENCEKTYSTPAVQEMIRNPPHYDVILMEQFNSDCMFGLAHVIGAPVIGLSSCAIMPWHYDRLGLPGNPSLIPSLFMPYSDQMNFQERLANWLGFFGMKALYYTFSDTDSNAVIQKYIGNHIPDVRELAKETKMFFVNQHYSLSGAKPLVPAVVEIGGIHIKPPKPIAKDLDDFINSAEHGVIVISWGSMVKSSSIPPEKLSAILNAIRQFKQKFVWKWTGDFPNKPANLYVSKWLPQREILCHANVKAFWAHGGLGGASEAAFCGVPVVATPFYGDQFLNSATFPSRGAGIVLKYEDFTTENIVNALKVALKPSTAEVAKKISYSYTHRPMSQVDTAVYWVEHVIATGGAFLKPSSPSIPWYICYGLDVYAVIIGALLVLLLSWILLLKGISRGFKKRTNVKVKSN